MKALISGQAATAVLIDGEAIHRLHLDEPDRLVPCRPGDVGRVFADVDDLHQIENATHSQVLQALEDLWERDRAMHLVLILLDRDAEPETRQLATECLDESLASHDVATFLADRLYAAPLPDQADAEGAQKHARQRNAGLAARWIEELADCQPYVYDRRTAWDSIPSALFDSADVKRAFEAVLIDRGYFRRAARAGDDPSAINGVLVDALMDPNLCCLARYRDVLMTWRRGFVLIDSRPSAEGAPGREEALEVEPSLPRGAASDYAVFERVNKQKDAIELLLKQGKRDRAWKYAEQLVAFQKRNSSAEQIAMSLCDLAQRAKRLYLPEDQLHFADRAVQIAPYDAQANTQLADSYRSLGRLDEALAAYDEAKARFPTNPVAHNGRAEVLKDLGRLDEALAAYDEARTRFPSNPVAHTGRAEVLKDLGRLDEALAAYDEARTRFPSNPVAHNGRAEVLKDLGRLDEALAAYDEALTRFPTEPVVHTGRAEVLKDLGRLDEALAAYDEARTRFPSNPVAHNGRAEVLKELGHLNEALAAYDEARMRFPSNPVAHNGRAEVLKDLGRLDEALAAYDEARTRFPSNPVAHNGRAEVLKELGHLNEALAAYAEARTLFPWDPVTRNGLASTLVVAGQFDKARAVLRTGSPRTRSDWVALHIRGMALLTQGDLDEAAAVFRQGLDCPFADERAYFRTALAMTEVRRRRFQEAARLIEKESAARPVLWVLRLHVFGELERTDEAITAYDHVRNNPNPNLVEVREELAARYLLDPKNHIRKPDDWVFEKEWRLAMCA